MKKIAVHLADGFEEIEAISIIDVLRRANFTVETVSITGKHEVSGSHKICVTADVLFEDLDYSLVDMIVLPGGMPGSANLKSHSGLREQIVKFNDAQKPLGAICAAPMVFGNLGLLRGKEATCYPGFEDELHGAVITGKDVELSDHIITGKGAGVAIQFALGIVAMLNNKTFADELATKMMVS